MWYKMILESFKNQTSKDHCLGYFMHQFKIRNDVYDQTLFFNLCKEHTISLKEAFEVILANEGELRLFPDPISEQVYNCEFVFGYDKSMELAIFGKKIVLIEVKDFENIIKALSKVLRQGKGEFKTKLIKDNLNPKVKSFKYKKIITGEPNLTDLMHRLKENELIAHDTKLATFRKIFSGGAIDKQVVWTGKLSELSYFVRQLHKELKLVEDLKQKQWVVAINCFVDVNGEQYKRKKLRWSKAPATSGIIDSLLNTLK